MDYEKYIDASLKTMRPKKLNESALYPDKVVGMLWQISASHPGYASDLLVLRKGVPTFVTTFMKSRLKAICFLSKADAKEYASTLTAPQGARIMIKQSPKNKVCASHPEITPGAYVVEETDIQKADIDNIPFVNKDGKIVTSKDDSYIKLTPGNVTRYIIEPLETPLETFARENVGEPLRKIFDGIAAEESTEHFELPSTSELLDNFLMPLEYYAKSNQIHLGFFVEVAYPLWAPEGFEWSAAEFIDAAQMVSHRRPERCGSGSLPGIQVGDNEFQVYYRVAERVNFRPNFLDRVGQEVSLTEIADMKEELKVTVEDWLKDTFSEQRLAEIKREHQMLIHNDMATIEATLPQFEYEEI